MNFAQKCVDFVGKLVNFAQKWGNFVGKGVDFVGKLANFARRWGNFA